MAHRISISLALLLALGCGGGTANTDSGVTDTGSLVLDTSVPADTSVTVDAGAPDAGVTTTVAVTFEDYSFTLDATSIAAGTVEFDAINNGTHDHEMVIARTDLAADSLPLAGDGTVDEAMLDVVGEISETAAGAMGSVIVDLTPGNYVLFCNVGNHYSRGMYATITVTAAP